MMEGSVWPRERLAGSPGILALDDDEEFEDEEWEEDEDEWDEDDEDEDDWEDEDEDDEWDDWDEDDEDTGGANEGRTIWNQRAA